MKTKTGKVSIGVVVLAGLSFAAQAYESGDWIVRAGYAAVDPRDDSSSLRVDGTAVGGTGVGVDSAGALGLSVSYMIAPHWGVELLAATPFKHDITARGLGGLGVPDGARIGSARQLPPTLSAQYYFADPGSTWQPFVGLGVNYTTFFHENLSNAAQEKLGASDLSLSGSWGLATELGLDWRPDAHWLVNATVWRIAIDTDASLNTALGRVRTHVDIDPWVYMIGAGYRF